MTTPNELAGLIEAAKELQDDLLMRGERDSDGTVIVNASFGRWKRFCEALTAAQRLSPTEATEPLVERVKVPLLISEGFAVLREAIRADRRSAETWPRISPAEAGQVLSDLREARAALSSSISNAEATWKCAARGSVGANDPQDCDYPNCGCDRAALPDLRKVLAELCASSQEVLGLLQNTPALQGREHICTGSRYADAIAAGNIALAATNAAPSPTEDSVPSDATKRMSKTLGVPFVKREDSGEVVQADREAAARLAEALAGADGLSRIPERFRNGSMDDKEAVQAFRDHRLSALSQSPSVSGEPVAWMYEKSDTVDWSKTRLHPVFDWKETPLYAAPQSPDSGMEALRKLNIFRAPKSETWDYQESGFAAGWSQCEELWRAEIRRVRASLSKSPSDGERA